MTEGWPALGPQWFPWDPAWRTLLGVAPVETQTVAGRTWATGSTAPAGLPPDLVPEGYQALWGARRIQGDLFDAVENFLDPMHTPFVHAGLVRSEGARSPVHVEVHSDGSSISATYRGTRRSGLIRSVFARSIDATVGRFRPPGIVELDYLSGPELRLRIVLAFTPLGPGELGLTVALVHALPRWVAVLAGLPLGPLLGWALRQDLALIAAKHQHEAHWFPERRYTHADTDLLGPYVLQWLRSGRLPTRDHTVEVRL